MDIDKIDNDTGISTQYSDNKKLKNDQVEMTSIEQFNFSLKNVDDALSPEIFGTIINNSSYGLALKFNGYSDFCSGDHQGFPIVIDCVNGDIRVNIFSNINAEDSTHSISLKNAQNHLRYQNKEESSSHTNHELSIIPISAKKILLVLKINPINATFWPLLVIKVQRTFW